MRDESRKSKVSEGSPRSHEMTGERRKKTSVIAPIKVGMSINSEVLKQI